jgi:trehalose 6-phosphate synthase/phosphatase
MTGAADELPEALRILPSDTSSIVAAMKTALKMPRKEQINRLRSMQRRLSTYTVQRWASDFMEQLEVAKRVQESKRHILLSTRGKDDMKKAFASASHRTLFLDYDGTLRQFVSSFDKNKAMPSKVLLQTLADLAKIPETDIYIISGRSHEALELWFKKTPVSLIAEHGAWVKTNGTWQKTDIAFEETKKIVRPILERYTDRTPGATIEEKAFSFVWHYRNSPPELAYERTSNIRHELTKLLDGTGIGVFSGNKIIEVKPRDINKGVAVAKIAALHSTGFILCIGDDYTDEDMFTALPDTAYTVKVGPDDTSARGRLSSVEEVLRLLVFLVH